MGQHARPGSIKPTDRQVTDQVFASYQVVYGINMPHELTVEEVYALGRYVQRALEQLETELLILPGTRIRLTSLKKKNCEGRYFNQTNVVELNIGAAVRNLWAGERIDMKMLVETLAHELVHAEQYASGRLAPKDSKSSIWEGVEMKRADPEKNYAKYRALPWEAEAFDRQASLAKACREAIGEFAPATQEVD